MFVKQGIKLLEWDTMHFGYKIASVRIPKLTEKDLRRLINDLQIDNYRLAYCYVDPSDEISNNSLLNTCGFIADEKVLFIKKIGKLDNLMHSSNICSYKSDFTSEKLKLLAFQSGMYSRFKLDEKFVNNEYEKLYFEWIDKSVKKEIADEILVYYKDKEEKGFVTLSMKNKIGSIGLIAVDEKERGNSIGKELMKAAFSTFKAKDILNVEVVTQKANTRACEFYKSLGFEVGTVENIYHLWIK
jgi:dTDP-4-amino-4,6-dideoxy-D-galactose acyltransferase